MSPNLLTIGMACYRNFDEVWFTLQSLRLMHGWGFDVVVVDNAPEKCRRTEAATLAVGGRYVHRPDLNGTSRPRDAVFQFARTEWVAVIDSHVILAPGSVARLIGDLAARPGSKDIFSGPMVNDDHGGMATHWQPAVPPGLWGAWALDGGIKAMLQATFRTLPADRAAVVRSLDAFGPLEVHSQGLGLFVMRKAAWPGFNSHFRGFGGEEGYIHEKVRRLGGTAWCLPYLCWFHKFRDIGGWQMAPYPADDAAHVRNLLISHRELGIDGYERLIQDHFGKKIDARVYGLMAQEVAGQVPAGVIERPPARQKILAVWYTNNSAPDKLLTASLKSIQTAADQTRHDVRVITVAWKPVPGNPFTMAIDWPPRAGVTGHKAIVAQQAAAVRANLDAGDFPPDVVCTVEHDVLYAPGYFDRIGDAFARNPAAAVVSHLDYIGLNGTGWLAVRERHEPLHQIGMRYDLYRKNLARAQDECGQRGWAFLEPDSDPQSGLPTPARDTWVRIPPDGFAPSVHVNHQGRDGMVRLTSHGEAVFEKTSTLAGGRPLSHHPFWGDMTAYWPHDVVIQLNPPAQAAKPDAGCTGCGGGDFEPAAGMIHPNVISWYKAAADTPSDFHEHAPTLLGLASRVKRVTQIGQWGKPSRQAFAAAGVQKFTDYSPGRMAEWATLKRLLGGAFDGIVCPPDGPAEIAETDLLFLDLRHTAEHTYLPLKRLHARVTSYVVVHCTNSYGENGELGSPGVLPGLRKFLQEHPEWSVIRADENNHGLMVLSKLAADRPKIEVGTARQAWSFLTTKLGHWLKGRDYLPLPMAEQRLAVCWLCPLRAGNRCSKCACYLDVVDPNGENPQVPAAMRGSPGRAFFPDRPCPVGKWHAVDPKTIPPEMYAQPDAQK